MLILFVWLGLCLATTSWAQTTVSLRSVHEITLTATGNYNNAYTQTGVTAVFRGPDGVSKTAPGFWDGSRTFKMRFTLALAEVSGGTSLSFTMPDANDWVMDFRNKAARAQ